MAGRMCYQEADASVKRSRQAGASSIHGVHGLTRPSIAHLIDAGLSPNGQPYLLLEYFQGEYVDRYCDNRHLRSPEDVPGRQLPPPMRPPSRYDNSHTKR